MSVWDILTSMVKFVLVAKKQTLFYVFTYFVPFLCFPGSFIWLGFRSPGRTLMTLRLSTVCTHHGCSGCSGPLTSSQVVQKQIVERVFLILFFLISFLQSERGEEKMQSQDFSPSFYNVIEMPRDWKNSMLMKKRMLVQWRIALSLSVCSLLCVTGCHFLLHFNWLITPVY